MHAERTQSNVYARLLEWIKDIGRLGSIGQLLEWDQDTYMPPRGVAARAEQAAVIAGLAHEKLVDDRTKTLLDEAVAEEGDFVAETNIRETRRAFERAAKIPTKLVREIAHTSAIAKEAWVKAREHSAFEEFAPSLEKMIELKRRLADCVGFEDDPYDALLDEFEPGARSADITRLFSDLKSQTTQLLQRITESPNQPDASILSRHFPRTRQEVISRRMAEALNFDFESGRADVTVHPFCVAVGASGDVRITTRYQEDFLPAAMFGTMHETGHALYEQGMLYEHRFTPMAEPVSLGIHESQSRLWENLVGRSRAFWTYHWDGLKTQFPESLGDVSLEDFYRAINTVRPSFIRVEADELTYNLHIVLRFEVERELLNGRLAVKDVPEAWNDGMQRLLGIRPGDDREGCLQDIHWSMGIFGYFPTYALGNLYAAQFFARARRDIPDLMERIAANDYKSLLDWLRENIHQHGKRFRAGELVKRVTGRPLSIEPFLQYVTEKFSNVYGLR